LIFGASEIKNKLRVEVCLGAYYFLNLKVSLGEMQIAAHSSVRFIEISFSSLCKELHVFAALRADPFAKDAIDNELAFGRKNCELVRKVLGR
jgi:hypothetical protein